MVALIRPPGFIDDGEGGQVRPEGEDATLPPVKRFYGSLVRQGEHIVTPSGEQFFAEHVLIGMPGDDIQKGDTFDIDGRTMYVRYIQPDKTYQVKAYVTSHANP